MKKILIIYQSRAGHTARIARCLAKAIEDEGHQADVYPFMEAAREGVDFDAYDTVVVGCPVLYGTYNKDFLAYIGEIRDVLDAKPHSFFNVSVVARTPIKATPEGNRYMQKFLKMSPWKPRDLKCFAGKVDYPHWSWLDGKMIQLIMKMTKGPTDPSAIIDYTDYEDLKVYAKHCLTLQ